MSSIDKRTIYRVLSWLIKTMLLVLTHATFDSRAGWSMRYDMMQEGETLLKDINGTFNGHY